MLYGMTSKELAMYYSEEDVIKIYKSIGFDAIDYSFDMHAYKGSVYDNKDYLVYARKIREVADREGILINQLHSPLFHHRIDVPMTTEEKEEEDFLKKMTERCFEVAEVLGCKYIVMHPRKMSKYGTKEDHDFAREYNIKMFRSYIRLAEKHNVKIALENMFAYDSITHMPVDTVFRTAEEIVSYIEELSSDVFVACLDTGHANVNGIDPAYMVEVLGKHLKVLHVHDNYAPFDQHLLCGLGTINWDDFSKALNNISYDEVVSLETFSMCENSFELASLFYAKMAYHIISNIVK